MTRTPLALAAALAVAGAVGAAPAYATSYRYWTYWSGSGNDWTFSAVGPAGATPADGTVQGWRFAVTEGVRGQGNAPRLAPAAAFRQFCGATPPAAGRKRVAVVLDFGDPADAPPGQSPPPARGTCVVAAPAATGAQLLSDAVTVRTDRGLVCALAGYPAGECAPAVTASPEPRSAAPVAHRTRSETSAPAQARRDPTPAAAVSPEPKTPAPAAPSSPGRSPAPQSSAGHSPAGQSSAAPSAVSEPPTPRPTPTSPGPAAAAPAGPTPSPVFVAAETVPAPAGSESSWLPAAGTVALLAAIGGVIGWRRRRGPTS